MSPPSADSPRRQTPKTAPMPRMADAEVAASEFANQRIPTLVVLEGWEIGREISIDKPRLTLGRAPQCDVVVGVKSVSREHACIEQRQGSFEVRDLGSSNGTSVNGIPVVQSKLDNGDRVKLGDVLMKFQLSSPEEHNFHQEVHRRMHYHELTGLLALPSFRERAEEILAHTGPAEHTLLMTDLDGLKPVNDTHGHDAGNMVIRVMGELIRTALREGDIAGLFGGDECVVLLPETSASAGEKLAECLRTSIEQERFVYREHLLNITISIGLASRPDHGVELDHLLRAADDALYHAKRQGRNRVVQAQKRRG